MMKIILTLILGCCEIGAKNMVLDKNNKYWEDFIKDNPNLKGVPFDPPVFKNSFSPNEYSHLYERFQKESNVIGCLSNVDNGVAISFICDGKSVIFFTEDAIVIQQFELDLKALWEKEIDQISIEIPKPIDGDTLYLNIKHKGENRRLFIYGSDCIDELDKLVTKIYSLTCY